MKPDIDELQKALKVIEIWITFIYDHEKTFIEEFLNGFEVWDITNISFSGYNCYVSSVRYSGEHVSNVFNAEDVINWMES